MGKIGHGSGFGKVILFGEHYTVYGLPGIASAVSDRTIATIEASDKYELIDNRPATEGYKDKKQGEIAREMKLILDFMKIDVEKTPVKITLAGNLFCTSGIGASAALATSVARAFSEFFGLDLNDEQVNRISYEGEKGSAGKPSGIDNTCSTFGGLLWFEKNMQGGENRVELIEMKEPVEIVLGNTGKSAVTSEVVEDVRLARERDPGKFKKNFDGYVRLAHDARKALEQGDIGKVGKLMDENHRLLQEIGVSCEELDRLVAVAKGNGAIGAKMTGTGRGGYMIALTPGKELQEKVANAIEREGFRVLMTRIG